MSGPDRDYREELAAGAIPLLAVTLAYGSGPALFMYTAHLFVEPIQAATVWSRGQVALGISIMLLISAVTLPLVGRLADRLGARTIGTVSFAGYATCCALLAVLPPSLPVYYTIMGMLAVFIPGSSAVVLSRPVTANFIALRGTALAVMYSGTAIVLAAVTPTLVSALSASYGSGYVVLALVAVISGIPLVWLATRSEVAKAVSGPIQAKDRSVWRGAVRSRAFRFLAMAILGSALGLGGVLNQLSSILLDRGLVPGDVAIMATFFAAAVLVGRLIVGISLDLLNPVLVSAGLMALAAFAALILVGSPPSFAAYALVVVLFGSAMGAEGDIAAYFIARLFGREGFSTLLGGISVFIAAGLAASGYLYGAWYDLLDSYRSPLYFSAISFALSSLFFVLMIREKPIPDQSGG